MLVNIPEQSHALLSHCLLGRRHRQFKGAGSGILCCPSACVCVPVVNLNHASGATRCVRAGCRSQYNKQGLHPFCGTTNKADKCGKQGLDLLSLCVQTSMHHPHTPEDDVYAGVQYYQDTQIALRTMKPITIYGRRGIWPALQGHVPLSWYPRSQENSWSQWTHRIPEAKHKLNISIPHINPQYLHCGFRLV